MGQFFPWSLCNFERTTFSGTFVLNYFCYGSVVQNKLLFEDLFCFSTGGWLYRSTVHISLFNFGIYGVIRYIFCDIIWATDSESCLNI